MLVERPDFRTPEAAGRSFLAAVGCDDAAAEYRCLSEALKRDHGATLDAWVIGRVEARREIGGLVLSRASSLEFLGSRATEAGLLTEWGFGGRPRLGLLMVEQHYFDLYDDRGPLAGELLEQAPGAYLRSEGTRLILEIPGALPKRTPPLAEVVRLELGTEWKLRDLVALDSGG